MIEIDNKILNDVATGFTIPAKPDILQALQDELSKEPELFRVADIIAADVATSAAVLKIINSPFYGLARTISDIRQAVMFLGLENITNLVTGYLLKQAYDQSKCSLSLNRFWDNANDIANVSCIIARHLKTPLPPENLHLIGLFHDAGIPAMAIRFEQYAKLLQEHRENDSTPLFTKEENRFKTNHAVVGYYLATSWNLPKQICQIILQHHCDDFFNACSDDFERSCFACLRLAENFVHIARHFRPEPQWHTIELRVLDTLQLDEYDFQDLKEDVEEYLISSH
ncbi:HDOD domain-containing protein [Pseudoalteromonas sp. G4]|uniref:HDOD domain-containing protein n=1 Tax=Pseudoalteromonas sp. G4 TaxID=2992761 RepID=UPI00237D5C6A|nr:HDOD domain-containing protein [Pseudoalteromonas sp. G4]MDE3271691.1 HDOD domain-containing protein [Pseudoalteromonas sp. G4]